MAGVTALGTTWPEILEGLRARRNVTRRMAEWERFADMGTKLAAPRARLRGARALDPQAARGMGRVSQLAVRATEAALERAGCWAIRC